MISQMVICLCEVVKGVVSEDAELLLCDRKVCYCVCITACFKVSFSFSECISATGFPARCRNESCKEHERKTGDYKNGSFF